MRPRHHTHTKAHASTTTETQHTHNVTRTETSNSASACVLKKNVSCQRGLRPPPASALVRTWKRPNLSDAYGCCAPVWAGGWVERASGWVSRGGRQHRRVVAAAAGRLPPRHFVRHTRARTHRIGRRRP